MKKDKTIHKKKLGSKQMRTNGFFALVAEMASHAM